MERDPFSVPTADVGTAGAVRRARERTPSVAAAIVHFSVVGLLVVAALGIGLASVLRRDTTNEAILNARQAGELMGTTLVQPALDRGILAAAPSSIARLDGVVENRLRRYDVVRVKVWTADGVILYSDEHRLIGKRYRLGAQDLETIHDGRPAADVSGLTAPENAFERDKGKLLQVYTRVTGPDGRPLLFEAYFPFHTVAASGGRLWREMGPWVLGALLLLALAQIPAAYELARKLRRAHESREALLVRAVAASDAERRRIASDLHDGVVQQLTGVSFVLAMAADTDVPQIDGALQSQLAEASHWTRDSIVQLRSLLTDLCSPSLQSSDLVSAISKMLVAFVDAGVDVTFVADYHGGESVATEALVFRCAQEALRNVGAHAEASTLEVRVCSTQNGIELVVGDNGRGFDTAQLTEAPVDGHVGVRLLRDLATSVGGDLEITSAPSAGTRLHLVLPRSQPTRRRTRRWRSSTRRRSPGDTSGAAPTLERALLETTESAP